MKFMLVQTKRYGGYVLFVENRGKQQLIVEFIIIMMDVVVVIIPYQD